MAEASDALRDVERRTYAAGALVVVRYGLAGLISLVGSAVLIRDLGAAAWATFAVSYFLVVQLDQAVGSRLLGSLLRGASEPDQAAVAAAARLLQIVGATLLVAFTGLGILLRSATALPDLQWALAAVGVCTYLYASRAVSLVLLERHFRFRVVVAAEVLEHLVFYTLACALALSGLGLGGVLVALAVRALPSAVVLRISQPTPFLGRWNPVHIKRLTAWALPTLVAGSTALWEGLVPVALLAAAHPVELSFVVTCATLVGYAAVAQFVIQRIGLASFAMVLRRTREFARAVERAYEGSAVLLVTMVAPIVATSVLWLPLLFGREWERASSVMVGMGLAYMCNGPLHVLTSTLYARGDTRTVLRVNWAMFALFAVSAVPATHTSPLLGIPTTYAVARLTGLIAVAVLVRRHGIPLRWWRGVLWLVAGTAMAAGVIASGRAAHWELGAGLFMLATLLWLPVLVRHRAWLGRLLGGRTLRAANEASPTE